MISVSDWYTKEDWGSVRPLLCLSVKVKHNKAFLFTDARLFPMMGKFYEEYIYKNPP